MTVIIFTLVMMWMLSILIGWWAVPTVIAAMLWSAWINGFLSHTKGVTHE